MKPYLVFSGDIHNHHSQLAVLYTHKAQPIKAQNDPHMSNEASLLYAVAADLGVPIVKTFQSRAFCLDVERILARQLSASSGVAASYFSRFA